MLVGEVALVVSEQAAARLGVEGLGDGVFEVGFLERVEGGDDGVDLGEGFVEVAFGCC